MIAVKLNMRSIFINKDLEVTDSELVQMNHRKKKLLYSLLQHQLPLCSDEEYMMH